MTNHDQDSKSQRRVSTRAAMKPEVLVCQGTMAYCVQSGLGQYNRNTANFLDPDKITLHSHTHTHTHTRARMMCQGQLTRLHLRAV